MTCTETGRLPMRIVPVGLLSYSAAEVVMARSARSAGLPQKSSDTPGTGAAQALSRPEVSGLLVLHHCLSLHAKTWLHETVGRVTPHSPCQTPLLLCDQCEREIFTRQKKTKNSRKIEI